MSNVIIKQINVKQEHRLSVLEELIKNIHNYTGEMLGIIEELKYMEFLKNDLLKNE